MANSFPNQLYVPPNSSMKGDVLMPGDKSITHRALMMGSIATGNTKITGALMGADCLATLKAMEQLGVKIHVNHGGSLISVEGVGLKGLKTPSSPLDLQNSGTSIRLLTGLLAGAGISAVLTGDESLQKRPMMRVVAPLRKMGSKITLTQEETPPIVLNHHEPLGGLTYELPVASAQVKSALLLAGLYASEDTFLIEPEPTRDHTERMLLTFGAHVVKKEKEIHLKPTPSLKACDIEVPGDLSSAAFFMVGATLAKEGEVFLRKVGMNPTRWGVIHILKQMGARIEILNERYLGSEPVADLKILPASLKGIHIAKEWVSLAIDEFPIIFIAAASAEGKTILEGGEELRVKESDRIATMARGLKTLGILVEESTSGVQITGGPMKGGVIDSHGDHRVAMSFAMASLRAKEPIHIHHCKNIETSFPNFLEICETLGLSIRGESSC